MRGSFAALLLLISTASAGIELKDVPAYLRLPLSPNANEMITAVVHDARPVSVWAAASADSRHKLELTSQGGETYQLNLGDPRLLAALRADGAQQFQIFAVVERGRVIESAVVRCTVAPAAKLAVPRGGSKFTIFQRRSKELPGSEGSIRVRIDDITGGQVLLTIATADGQTLVDEISVKPGAEVAFCVNEAEYVIVVEKLVNRLMSEDWAELRLVSRAECESQKIEAAIRRIESSGLTFIRNGTNHTPTEAAKHLRTKLEAAGDKIKTYDQFVEHIASKSSLSGEPYLVRHPDGTTVELAKWLRE